MTLTWAASRALLRQQYVLRHFTRSLFQFSQLFSQSQNGPNRDPDDYPLYPSATIHRLPNDVLLEIFDSFRQLFQLERRYEKIWNSNRGWFKLAHVCQEWREVVLTSPSRLCLRLLITVFRSGRSIAIRRLPPLPIVIDHKPNTRTWHFKVQQRLISGLAYPDVCVRSPSRCPLKLGTRTRRY